MFKCVLFLFCVLFVGCQTTTPLTPQQRRTLQVRIFSGSSYETVFRSFKTVLQDEGYIISNQDMAGGLVVAEAQKTNAPNLTLAFLHGINAGLGGRNYRHSYKTSQNFMISVNLEEIKKKTVEARIILRQKSFYSDGGRTGNEIVKPDIYRNIFSKVALEIQRRKALKRK